MYNHIGGLSYKGTYLQSQKIGYWYFDWFGKRKTEFYL